MSGQPEAPDDLRQRIIAALDAASGGTCEHCKTEAFTRQADAVMAVVEDEAVDRMAETFVEETRIKSMDFRNGAAMDLEPSRTLVANWVGAARGMLGDAPNYSETEIDFGLADPPGYEMEVKLAGEVERYVFRVQRRGKLTPHQARQLAEARAQAAEARLAELENAVTWGTSCTSCARVLDSAYAETTRREAAEAKLAEIEAHCRGHLERAGAERGSVCCPHLAEDILAITGTGEPGDGD